jgi:hypothetical protein
MQQAKHPLKRYREGLIERYAAQADELRAAVRDKGERMHTPLAPGEWTPHQVLAHVAAAESLAFVPRLKRIASEDHPQLPSWDESAWMQDSYQPEQESETSLEMFESARREGLDVISGLAEDAWNRAGRHPSQGDRTLQWWLEYSVSHVDDHLNQLKSSG